MALGYLPVDLMVNETSLLLIVQVDPDLTFRFGGGKGFAERGLICGEKMFCRDIVY